MYLFRELTDYSYPAIARVFGGRDHTTVIHAVEKIAGQMQERRQIYDQVTDLIQKIRAGRHDRSASGPPPTGCGSPGAKAVDATAPRLGTGSRLSPGPDPAARACTGPAHGPQRHGDRPSRR